MLRYYITDRTLLGGNIPRLLDNIERNSRAGVEYIQVREKDLSGRELLELTRAALERVATTNTRILVNDRADVAVGAGAHGVHLRSNPIPPHRWRSVLPAGFLIAASAHTLDDVSILEGADFIVYGPVFDTPGKGPAIGLQGLAKATRSAPFPVFALGGITDQNAADCMRAGAAGIAGIRLFQADGVGAR